MELRDRLTDEAKRRGMTVGRLLTDILTTALPSMKNAPTIEERVARLERCVAESRSKAAANAKRRR